MPWVLSRRSAPRPVTAGSRPVAVPGRAGRWRSPHGGARAFVFTGDRSLMVHVALARSVRHGDAGSYRAARIAADRLALAVTLLDEDEILAMPWTVMRALVAVCARRAQTSAMG